MALSNVSVGKSDVQKFQPDVEDYLFNGQDINDVIALVKRSIEREIQIKNDVEDEDVSKIKDTTQKYLHDRIIQDTLAQIYLQNGQLDKADVHQRLGASIPLRYYLDDDGDGVADDGEKDIAKNVFFGR